MGPGSCVYFSGFHQRLLFGWVVLGFRRVWILFCLPWRDRGEMGNKDA